MTGDELAEIDAWIGDVHTGSDGIYIESRLVIALREEVERLRALVGSLGEDATAHMPGEPQAVTLPVTYNMYPAALALKRLLPPERVNRL